MPYRKKADCPQLVRDALLEGVRLQHAAALKAKNQLKVRIYMAAERGLTTRDIALELGISQQSVSRYRIEGEAAYDAQKAAE